MEVENELSVVTPPSAPVVGITGIGGLIGWHLRCRLYALKPNCRVVPADRTTFGSRDSLDAFVSRCDAIVHLAGMNRGDEIELEATNPALAEALVGALERTDRQPHIVFSSSTHAGRDTPYGRSKQAASDVFHQWAQRSGAVFTNMVLPHVFGESGRPFYNSVVSTFCHQIAHGEQPVVQRDGDLELLHAQQVAAAAIEAIERGTGGELRPSGKPIRVSGMLASLMRIAESYTRGVIPDLRDAFELQMFNTYRSYLFPTHYPVRLQLHTDQRGSLFEAVKTDHGGQAFLSSTRPGVTRGGHFHLNKVERFIVIQGEAVIRLRRLFDDEVWEFHVAGDEPVFIDMPTLHTHTITNTGTSDLLTLFWAHEIFDPERSDTYPEPVTKE